MLATTSTLNSPIGDSASFGLRLPSVRLFRDSFVDGTFYKSPNPEKVQVIVRAVLWSLAAVLLEPRSAECKGRGPLFLLRK